MAYGTTDRCTGGSATASSTFGGSAASNGFDNNDATSWTSNAEKPSWLKYDFGAGITWQVGKITILNTSADSGYRPKATVIAGSNNDSAWTTLWSGNLADVNTLQTVTFNNATKYRYIRITISSNWGADYNYGNLYEVSAYEILQVNGFSGVGDIKIF